MPRGRPRKNSVTEPKPEKPKASREEMAICREIINLFCKEPINWPREIKIAKDLIKKYPTVNFWKSVDLGFKLPCLAYFKTATGSKLLELTKKKIELALPEKEVYTLNTEKIGEDVEVDKKPKTLKEFLEYGKS